MNGNSIEDPVVNFKYKGSFKVSKLSSQDGVMEVEFSNGALKDKLVSRVATALALYPRSVHPDF